MNTHDVHNAVAIPRTTEYLLPKAWLQTPEQVLKECVPCSTDHPYFTRYEMAPAGLVFKGEQIGGIPCHGAVVFPMMDRDGVAVNVLAKVPNASGAYEDLMLPGCPIAHTCIRLGPSSDRMILVTDVLCGVAIQQSTGQSVAVTLFDQNSLNIGKWIRTQFPEQQIVVALRTRRPSDLVTMVHFWKDAADEISVTMTCAGEKKTFLDLFNLEGPEAVKAAIEKDGANLKTSTLAPKEGEEFFPVVTPWPTRVNPHSVLTNLYYRLCCMVSAAPHQVAAIVLWTAVTHFVEVCKFAALLAVLSPTKRSGKTTVAEPLTKLVRRPFPMSNTSVAALFRCTDKSPTLLFDEMDQQLQSIGSDFVGILNSGHTRKFAYVIRATGKGHKRYNTFCHKLVAMIGEPPSTVLDRAIVISLLRKRVDEALVKYVDSDNDDFDALRAQLEALALGNLAAIKTATPLIPPLDSNRAMNNWEHLLAVSELAGDFWAQLGRDSATLLTNSLQAYLPNEEQLIVDLADIFRRRGAEFLPTVVILEELCRDPDARWSSVRRGAPINGHFLGQMLGKFLVPKGEQERFDGGASPLKGYRLRHLADLFERYAPAK